MTFKYESWMGCKIIATDGNYTIGYVGEDEPAEWDGNNLKLEEGQEYRERHEDCDFNTGNELWVVKNGMWILV
jgi:hypothetical protein